MQKIKYKATENNILTGCIQFSNSSNVPRYDRLTLTQMEYHVLPNGTMAHKNVSLLMLNGKIQLLIFYLINLLFYHLIKTFKKVVMIENLIT